MSSLNHSTLNGAGLERVRYFARQLLTADDMLAEQQYFRQKLRRHNRFLHGWGVVCGLRVLAAPDDTTPWRVKIEPGYALGPYGDEIYLAEPYCFDLTTSQDLVLYPCEPGQPPKPAPLKSDKLYVALRYVECESRPVRVHPLGCACEEALCEYSRTRDDFEVACLADPPKNSRPSLLCDLRNEKQIPECPPYPESPWVVLAEVSLPTPTATEPDASKIRLADDKVKNHVRRQLFSAALIQEQLIASCCDKPMPTDVVVSPPIPDPVNLFFNKTASKSVDKSITYTITVAHQGKQAARSVIVTDRLLEGTRVDDNSFKTTPKGEWKNKDPKKGELRAELGDLNPGEKVELKFTIKDVGTGEHKNVATVNAENLNNPLEATAQIKVP